MPLLSIIIPTHNRQALAEIVVRKTHAECPDAEIVVSDTSSDETLRARLQSLIDSGSVTYVRPSRPLDVVSHFEFALGHAHGDYLMFIGDDDCVGPGIVEVAGWALRNDVDAVISYTETFLAIYFWPGVKSKYYGDGYAGRLFVNGFDGGATPVDPQAALRKVLRHPGRGLGSMPRIYHGLVARSLVDRIVAKYGSLFGGVSPDIYSATMIAMEAKRVWRIDYPFCIPGGSPASTAGTGAARSDRPSLWENPHISPFTNLAWDPLIPEFYAAYTVWAFSLKRALDRLGRPDLQPNYPRLYAFTLLYARDYRALSRSLAIYVVMVGRARAYAELVAEVVKEIGFQARRFGKRLLSPGAGGRAEQVAGLADIERAYDALLTHIGAKEVSLGLPPTIDPPVARAA